MLDKKDKEYFDLSGALVYDPCIGNWDFVQQEVPVVPFVQSHLNTLGYNSTFMADLETLFHSCGYADWIDVYVVFLPKGQQPAVLFDSSKPANSTCAVWDMLDVAAFDINPCFDIYAVNELCPLPWDVLGHQTQFNYVPDGATVYPNRTDVKNAMHDPHIPWHLDQVYDVFVADGGDGGPEEAGDTSPDPIQGVLPQVIEATNRVLVANGNLDMIIITNGTLMSIQNMTWNGKLGFQEKLTEYMVVDIPDLEYRAAFDASSQAGRDGPQGVVGIKHYERGLMWVETSLGTHTQPESQPRAAYKHLQWLLGRIDDL